MWLFQKGGCDGVKMGHFPEKSNFISKDNLTVIERQQNQKSKCYPFTLKYRFTNSLGHIKVVKIGSFYNRIAFKPEMKNP